MTRGHGERDGGKGNIRSFRELRVWRNAMDAAMSVFDLTRRCGYLSQAEADSLDRRYDTILGKLVTMIEKPGSWVVDSQRRRA